MKLTVELLGASRSALNAVRERELDLRGHKIPAIENLGTTRDQNDTIDFTDNALVSLSNLPLMKRLHTLLLSNNRISHISPSLHLSAPNITTIVFTNNLIAELGDLEPLQHLRFLEYMSLLGNPVRERKWYREWLAFRIKALRVLDFQRIRDKERTTAKSLFLTEDELLTDLATRLSTTISAQSVKGLSTEEPRQAAAAAIGRAGRLMSEEERTKVKLAIANATSADEVVRLERSLKEGFLPE
ncbi:L domain-like protein [Auriculariales sp. MPI-PUGE-AT-0066]|nr:L domain-like protein [Auriculariales sp. MPI-PUGE-AT-0066]